MIEVRELSKSYTLGPEVLGILTEISFAAQAGESVVISGRSGSGKTTLLNCLGGLDTPDAGSVEIDGTDIVALSDDELASYRGKEIGFIFQFHHLLKDFTALENVLLPMFMAGTAKSAASKRARELLSDVGLVDRSDHYPHQLSGGERQRVAVARSMVNDPAILLADEPTGNLDAESSGVVEDLIFELSEKHGKTLILVTHDRGIARRGSRSLVLERGALRTQ